MVVRSSAPIILILLILAYPAHGLRLPTLETAQLTIIHEVGMERAARRLVEFYGSAKASLEAFFGLQFEVRPTIILVQANRFKAVSGGNSLLVAYAIPRKGTVVINHSAFRRSEADLKKTLKHELCHLFLHSMMNGNGQLPKWLEEGICQVVSGTLGEVAVTLKGNLIDEALRRGRLLRLEALSEGFPPRVQELALAYEQSRVFVTFLINNYGKDKLLSLIEILSQERPPDEALLELYGHSLQELQLQWQNTLRGPADFLARLGAYLYEILFGIGAFLMIIAFGVQLIRKRRSYRSEETVEEAEESAP